MPTPLNAISPSSSNQTEDTSFSGSTSDTTEIPSALKRSWQQLETLDQLIIELADNKQWQQLTFQAVTRRRVHDEHFQQYPVGPVTSEFYKDKLARLFEREYQIDNLAKTARRLTFKECAVSAGN